MAVSFPDCEPPRTYGLWRAERQPKRVLQAILEVALDFGGDGTRGTRRRPHVVQAHVDVEAVRSPCAFLKKRTA